MNQDIVDWVKLELRDPAAPNTATTFKASAFLKKDGTLVGLDGTSLPRVKNGFPTSVVVVSHRNHLSVRTLDGGINVLDLGTPYDLTGTVASDTTVAYRKPGTNTNPNLKLVTGTNPKLCLWGGNGNGNTNVRFATTQGDYNYLLNTSSSGTAPAIGCGGSTTANITNVYSNADFTLNGAVRFATTGGDYNFLINSVLSGSTTKIINQHL